MANPVHHDHFATFERYGVVPLFSCDFFPGSAYWSAVACVLGIVNLEPKRVALISQDLLSLKNNLPQLGISNSSVVFR